MIITAEEYRSMGFTAQDDDTLNNCLLRTEYIIAGLTEGRHESALAAGGVASEFVKQAAAFQTFKLVREEESRSDNDQPQQVQTSERVSIGDYSYATESRTTNASASNDSDCCYDLSMQTVRLLRAAGCLFTGRQTV